MYKRLSICAILLCSGSAFAESSATVYKCTDAYGKITYANVPCDGHREVMPEWKLQGTVMPALPTTTQKSASGASSTSGGTPSSTSDSESSSISKKIDDVSNKLEKSWKGLFSEETK